MARHAKLRYPKARRTKMRDLPKVQRPRERLSAIGPYNLTSVELLAAILGSGTKGRNALVLARKILHDFSLKDFSKTKISDLVNIKGIGPVQATKILAAIELGRRANEEISTKKMLSPEDILREVDDIRAKEREYLVALYLNARYELVEKQTITIGSLNQNIVEPGDIFGLALSLPCALVIVVHNHPSGDPGPSEDDKAFTKRLKKAGKLLGVGLVDHIIVSKKNYFSFKEAGL